MKIGIESNILRHYLQNVYFITGTAYAGKSTMAAMLAEKYGMIHCGENYHDRYASVIATPDRQPGLCYFSTMKDWQEFVNRTPEEYERWIIQTSGEAAEFEIVELIRLSQNGKVIADTNIPLDILREISDYHHVAVMLSPQAMSVEMFFERDDPDKKFLLEQIRQAENPQKTLANFKACIAKLNSRERYDEYANSGFYTILRETADVDTRAETLDALARHFRLTDD